MSGRLYVVGTPIGNLGDISPRALDVLSSVDFIAAEDTRVTLRLLNHFGIKKQLISYFEHNKLEKGDIIVSRLISGESCAIVTDAGMPVISDPGENLVRRCRLSGIDIESVPGPSALVTALAISGVTGGRFCFEGFLSVNKRSRNEHLDSLKNERRTMIFYEAPHKLKNTLKDFYEVFGGDREISVCRELTKIHEQVILTTVSKAVEMYDETVPKGEFVLVVKGADAPPEDEETDFTLEDAVSIALEKAEGGLSASAAAKFASQITGFKKNDIYSAMCGKKSI